MASEAAGSNQGAKPENLSEGQSNGEGAPKAPEVKNAADPKEDKQEEVKDTSKEKVPAKDDDPKKDDNTTDSTEDDTEDDEDKVELKEYSQFDDPSANAAVDLLKEAGVTPAEAEGIFSKAIESGDLRDINVQELEAKVGKTKALLVMNGVKDFHTRTKTRNEKAIKTIKDVFGGEAGWNTVRDWAQTREGVDASFKKELDSIREDLNMGGRAAKAAAQDLLKLYNGAEGTKGLGTKTGNLKKGGGKPAPDGSPLSRSAYLDARKKAHEAGASQAEIAQLGRRRLAGKKQGI